MAWSEHQPGGVYWTHVNLKGRYRDFGRVSYGNSSGTCVFQLRLCRYLPLASARYPTLGQNRKSYVWLGPDPTASCPSPRLRGKVWYIGLTVGGHINNPQTWRLSQTPSEGLTGPACICYTGKPTFRSRPKCANGKDLAPAPWKTGFLNPSQVFTTTAALACGSGMCQPQARVCLLKECQ